MLGYLRANSAPEPEDICSEAMLQVARDLAGFTGDEAGLRAWALRITHHRLLDARRHSARRPSDPVADVPERPSATHPDAASEVLQRGGRERVVALLGELSDDQRAVLTLRILGELTVPEVAEVIGKREGAVKQLQRRGLAAIRSRLGREGVTL